MLSTEGAEGGGVWGGGIPCLVGEARERAMPPPRKFFDFLSNNGAFWALVLMLVKGV